QSDVPENHIVRPLSGELADPAGDTQLVFHSPNGRIPALYLGVGRPSMIVPPAGPRPRLDDRDRVGDVDAGWTVVTGWLHHERAIAGGSSSVTSAGSRANGAQGDGRRLVQLAPELVAGGAGRRA